MPPINTDTTRERVDASSILEDRLLTTAETAEMIGVHPKSLVRARIYDGPLARIPHLKIGKNVRYRLSEVDRFLRLATAHTVNDHRFG